MNMNALGRSNNHLVAVVIGRGRRLDACRYLSRAILNGSFFFFLFFFFFVISRHGELFEATFMKRPRPRVPVSSTLQYYSFACTYNVYASVVVILPTLHCNKM